MMYGSDTISKVCVMVAAVVLQSSAEALSSMSGINSRHRAQASESDVRRAASLLRQAQRCCPQCITNMQSEQHLRACAGRFLSKVCLAYKGLPHTQSSQMSSS